MTAGRHMAMVLGTVLGLTACAAPAQPPPSPSSAATASDPRSDGDLNVRLVGYHDLQGRQSLVVTTRSDAANGNWVYVGHTPNDRSDPQASDDGQGNDQPILNPITGKMEWNGTSIVEISRPGASAARLAHPERRGARQLTLGLGGLRLRLRLRADGTRLPDSQLGHRARSSSSRSSTSRRATPIRRRSRSSPRSPAHRPDNCGPGCGGTFINRAHKGYWSQRSGLFYSSSGEPGFRGLTLIHIWDLKDPRNPKFVGRAASPSQREGEPGYQGEYAHHPIVDEPNNRLYIGFRGAGPRRRLGHLEPGHAEAGVDDRHQPARPRAAHGVADRLRPGAELQGPGRPAADLRVHHRRSGGRGRHEAVHQRHPHQGLHGRHHGRNASVPGVDLAGAGRATSATRAAGSVRISTPRPSTARSTGSRTSWRGSRTSTPASAWSICRIRTT